MVEHLVLTDVGNYILKTFIKQRKIECYFTISDDAS